jgi:hypothetical protein
MCKCVNKYGRIEECADAFKSVTLICESLTSEIQTSEYLILHPLINNMKKTICILLICFTSISVFAQDWSDTKYKFNEIYPGYIVTLAGDTVNGYISHSTRSYAQENCIFYSDASKKDKKKYKPKELKAYGVADKHYRSILFSAGLMKQSLNFVLLTKPGRISQFLYYQENDALKMQGKNESYADYDARIHTDEILWQKLDENPVSQQGFILGFAKKVSKMTADYPELSAKVENKEKGFGLLNVNSIMDEYNEYWLQKSNSK